MAKLTCLNSVSQWENEQILRYPDIKIFIEKLKKMIREKPQDGLDDPLLSGTGKVIPCLKRSIAIDLFSYQYAIGYSYITANYVYNGTDVVILKMYFS